MAQIDEKVDVFLVRSRGIENREAHQIADVEEELFQTAALARYRRLFFPGHRSRCPGDRGGVGRACHLRNPMRNGIAFLAEDGA